VGREKQSKQPENKPATRPAFDLDAQEDLQALASDAYRQVVSGGTLPLDPDKILALQKTAGNSAVRRLLEGQDSGQQGHPLIKTRSQTSHLNRSASDGPILGKGFNDEEELAKGFEGINEPEKSTSDEEPLQKDYNDEEELRKRFVGEEELGKSSTPVTPTVGVLKHGPNSVQLPEGLCEVAEQLAKVGVKSGATPSRPIGNKYYGLTWPESVEPKFSADKDGDKWRPKVTGLIGHYSLQASLGGNTKEVSGPDGNTTASNYANQLESLLSYGVPARDHKWYMKSAIVAHEKVHAKKFKPSLKAVAPSIKEAFREVHIPDLPGMDEDTAGEMMKSDVGFESASDTAKEIWLAEILTQTAGDHDDGGACHQAEDNVVSPMIDKIYDHVKENKWPGYEKYTA
jgi:hypothetical protein